jgi:hypothetical protein
VITAIAFWSVGATSKWCLQGIGDLLYECSNPRLPAIGVALPNRRLPTGMFLNYRLNPNGRKGFF